MKKEFMWATLGKREVSGFGHGCKEAKCSVPLNDDVIIIVIIFNELLLFSANQVSIQYRYAEVQSDGV